MAHFISIVLMSLLPAAAFAWPVEEQITKLQDMDATIAALRLAIGQGHASALEVNQAPGPAPGPALQPVTISGSISTSGAATSTASTPQSLNALSQSMSNSQAAEKQAALTMKNAHNAAVDVEKFQRKKSAMAGSAETAHIQASDALKEASDLANEAAIARKKANEAVAEMHNATELLQQKQTAEYQARVQASDQKKNEKKAQVAFETASMKAEQLKSASMAADAEAAAAREAKQAKDDQKAEADNILTAATDKLRRLQEDAEEKNTTYNDAVAASDKASADAANAMQQEVEMTSNLGARTAEAAKAKVQAEVATKNRELARSVYDKKLTEAHKQDAVATQATARAKAAELESKALAEDAAAKAAAV